MSQVIVVNQADLEGIVQQAVRTGVLEALRCFERPDTVMRTDAAAAYIGVKPSTLRMWRCQGRGPAYVKNGNTVVYTKAALDAYLDRNAKDTADTIDFKVCSRA